MEVDCIYYECEKCTILKKLYCKTEKCSFYKQDKIKEKKEKAKQYRETHKEKIKEYNKKYRELNKEKIKEHHKEYYENKISRTVRTKMTDEERKAKSREYGKFYYQKHKLNRNNEIKYINYGELIFSDEEIEALKSGKLKIY